MEVVKTISSMFFLFIELQVSKMNTFELTKIIAGLCGSLLILLLIQWGGEIAYHADHKEIQTASYYLEIEEEEVVEEEEEESIPFTEMVALANIDKGKKVFGKCKACHKLEKGINGTGPHLYGIIGRTIASVENFGYSSALAGMSGVWSEDELSAFLIKPAKYAPGTKMSYSGLGPVKDRANLIAFLKTIKD